MEQITQTELIDCNISDFISLLQRIRRLKPFLRGTLPESLVEMLARLKESPPGGRAVSLADFELLHTVSMALVRQAEPVTMGELSRLLDVPLSTATRIVDWLVQSGFAERLDDPQDRRVVRVGLTSKGRQTYQSSNDYFHLRLNTWLQKFTPEECRTLVRLLSRLVDAMEDDSKE